MIAIIQINNRKSILKAETMEKAIEEAKRILDLRKTKYKECNVIICKETQVTTLKNPKKDEKI